jgi:uncharacterized membrane protein
MFILTFGFLVLKILTATIFSLVKWLKCTKALFCLQRVNLYAIWHEISLCDQLSSAICREESWLPKLLMGQSFC